MRAAALVSGGVDSAVALVLASKMMTVVAVHCAFKASEEGARRAVAAAARHLRRPIKTYFVPFEGVLRLIVDGLERLGERRLTCVLCKRAMLRAAGIIGKTEGCEFLVTGEAVGQVASQTLPNLAVLERAVDLRVLRPLAGLSKIEIERLARRLGLEGRRAARCPYVPPWPATRARIEDVERAEASIGVEDAVLEAVKRAEVEMIGG